SPIPLVLPILYLAVHSLLVGVSGHLRRAEKARMLVLNLVLAGAFVGLCRLASGLEGAPHGWQRILLLWGPVVFFWWAYLWSRHTLTAVHPPGAHIDAWLIRLEDRMGQPSLGWARRGNRLLTEILLFCYGTYYLYTPVLGLYLDLSGRVAEFQAVTAAVCGGYLVSYTLFALVPAFGPRWSLVEQGRMEEWEQRMRGYGLTAAVNRLMFDGPALKGGAMPSSHSSTALVFLVWSWWLGGVAAGVPALIVVGGMWVGSIYGRYHFVTDVLAGLLLGLGALLLMNALIL
ncbi:MAG: phosphatase PAP2 family protein, partial [Acidobacteriota bacterium]